MRVDGFSPDRDPVVQASAAANDLSQIVQVGTQRKHFVRPVVLYPGWFVEKQPKGVKVWVLSPRALPSFLRHEPAILQGPEIAVIRTVITAHIRTKAAARSAG